MNINIIKEETNRLKDLIKNEKESLNARKIVFNKLINYQIIAIMNKLINYIIIFNICQGYKLR